jgi:hypothetical protein
MKVTLAFLSLVCCSSLAAENVQKQKRSLGLYDGIIGGTSYGLPVDTSVSSHTHTHTTSVIEKPVFISSPTITTTKIISPAIRSTILPSYEWPSTYGKIYSGYDKFYQSGYGWPAATFSKSYYTSPIYKSYKW